jgi:hypothetical protein
MIFTFIVYAICYDRCKEVPHYGIGRESARKALPPERLDEVEDFVDFMGLRAQERSLARVAAATSEAAFAKIWSNPDDNAYVRFEFGDSSWCRSRSPAARLVHRPLTRIACAIRPLPASGKR